MKIITVSREFGSGGREIAKRLSDVLGIAYYDSEIITEIAKKADLDENYVAHSLEKAFSRRFRFTLHVLFLTFPLRIRRLNCFPLSTTSSMSLPKRAIA